MKNNKQKFKRALAHITAGFTLIELMVATSIFMVVMLVAMGSLVTTSDTAKKSHALSSTMDNLSFAMESMTRNIRMGTNYYCSSISFVLIDSLGTQDCISGGTAIAFIPAGDSNGLTRTVYKLNNTTNKIERCGTNIPCVDIIASNIKIDIFKFFVRGSALDNVTQPSVYMIVKGTVTIKNKPTSFAIQTMVSQRTIE